MKEMNLNESVLYISKLQQKSRMNLVKRAER